MNFRIWLSILVASVVLSAWGDVAIAEEAIQRNREIILQLPHGITPLPFGVDSAGRTYITAGENQVLQYISNSPLIYVKRAYKGCTGDDSMSINNLGVQVLKPRLRDYWKLVFADSILRDNVFDSLRIREGYLDIVKNHEIQAQVDTVNDPLFAEQWNIKSTVDNGIDAMGAWNYTFGNSNITVAIIDFGVKYDHPDLYPRVRGDYGNSDHATAIAGIIGAATNNDTCIAGIAPGIKMLSADITWNEYADLYRDMVDSGCEILNLTYGGTNPPVWADRRALAYAYKMNRVVVSAKGNNDTGSPFYPADYGQGIISVASYNQDGIRSDFSNYGNDLDVSAPGEGIPSLDIYTLCDPVFTGTSYSAPHVAAMAALLLSYDSSLYNDDIENILKYSATDIEGPAPAVPGYDDYTGYGRLNASGAFAMLQPPNLLQGFLSNGGTIYSSTGLEWHIFYDIPGLPDQLYLAKKFEVRKELVFDLPYLSPPHAWGRGANTVGYSDENPNCGMGFTRVIDGTITSYGCDVSTFVYQVYAISGQSLGWFPCPPENVAYSVGVLGECLLQAAPYITAHGDNNHQSIYLTFEDPNPYEDGWIIERRDFTTLLWHVIDTIPNDTAEYKHYEDYYPVGGETYSYRVKAFTVKQQNAEYSQSFTLTSKPFYPINLAAHTTDYRLPVPIFGGCGEEDFAMGEGEMMTEGLIEEELDDPVEPVYCPRLFGNDVTLTWSPAPNQKYPITNYFVKRIVPPNGPTWQVGTDTCLYICPNPYMSNLNYEIYAVNSNGDTSLPASVGGCTGSVNTCPGTPGKAGNTRNESLPLKFDLGQNRPNPFNLTTVISFSLPSRQYTRLEIFDVLGRMVKSLINGEMTPGSYDIGWDGTDDSGNPLSSGVYVYRLAAGHDASTKKMVMVK